MMTVLGYLSPYWGKNFGAFFLVFFQRLYLFLSGNLHYSDLATDEIQILVLSAVAISCDILGVFLVLKKVTMLANSLSHTILLGIVVAYLLTSHFTAEGFGHQPINLRIMLIASLSAALVTTFLTELLKKVFKLQEDASIGLVFTSLFALGIILVTIFTRNVHIGTEIVMGNVDALHFDDLKLVWILVGINALILSIFFKEFKITTFDSSLAKILGISTIFFNYLMMVQLSATVIGAFRAVGVILVLAFLVGPFLIARLFLDRLKMLLFLTPAIGVFSSIIGIALARHLLSVNRIAISTGGLVVCVIACLYLVALTFKLKSFPRKKVVLPQRIDI